MDTLLIVQGTNGQIIYREKDYLPKRNQEGRFLIFDELIQPALVIDDKKEKQTRTVVVRN